MPELPEVETIARGLREKVLGRRIASVQVWGALVIRSDRKRFATDLQGQTVQALYRHGKFLFLTLQPSSLVLKIHLGMTGQLLFEAPSMTPLKHTHIGFRLTGLAEELRYRDIRRFGFLKILKKIDSKLGPDAWDSSDEVIFETLRKKSGMLKNTLLNQGVIAGLGNIYVDESLYRTGLHPRKTLESLRPDKLRELCVSIRAVLSESLQAKGTTISDYRDINGQSGGFDQRLRVYGKEGTPCRVCGGKIRKILAAGRGTHFCSRCQRAPR